MEHTIHGIRRQYVSLAAYGSSLWLIGWHSLSPALARIVSKQQHIHCIFQRQRVLDNFTTHVPPENVCWLTLAAYYASLSALLDARYYSGTGAFQRIVRRLPQPSCGSLAPTWYRAVQHSHGDLTICVLGGRQAPLPGLKRLSTTVEMQSSSATLPRPVVAVGIASFTTLSSRASVALRLG
ncbi:hypothetical protein IWX90DRAFT_211853 [Phyllosticta citrichinensis]|uniref:Uncharacterized protein n=1 Tax=Phyllosticta citrichinensis TaxID=1130410 RepID=A0ABR1XSZ0_9PEZI